MIVFRGGDDGRGYRNMCKIAGGSKPILRTDVLGIGMIMYNVQRPWPVAVGQRQRLYSGVKYLPVLHAPGLSQFPLKQLSVKCTKGVGT
jgi:hypothetical protein